MNDKFPGLLSIVTVCLNDIVGLKRTHASLQFQTFRDFEWIVVDGASSDGTVEYLRKFTVGECSYSSSPDNGLYDAMNKGIQRASGSYILFLNSGDVLANRSVLESISSKLNSESVDLVYGDSLEHGQESIVYKPARSHLFLWYGMFTHHQAMFYSRKAIHALRYETKYPIGADYGLTAALLTKGGKAKHVPIPVCLFESGGLSSRNLEQGLIDQYRIRREILQYNALICSAIRLLHRTVYRVKTMMPRLYEKLRYLKG